MTRLNKHVHRVSNHMVKGKPVVVTIAPGSEKRHDVIAVRLLGERTQYLVTLADIYRWGALAYANKEKAAKTAARKAGIPWRTAKKQFVRDNSI